MLRGFNTLRHEANFDGGGLAPDAGLTPDGLPHEAPPEPEQEQGWQGVSQEQWESQQEQLQQMSALVQQLAPVAEYMQGFPGQGQQQQEQGQPFDLFADDAEDRIRNMIREENAPYREIVQERQHEELVGRAKDMISDTENRLGELTRPQYGEGQSGLAPADLVLQLAQSYSPAMVNQYGPGVRADEAAIEKAYSEVKSYQEALVAAAEQREYNQASTLSSAPREPSGSGVASQPLVTTQPGGWEAFKSRHNLS